MQRMLDICAKNILPECEMIRMREINEAYERKEHADVRHRFVIDMASL
jgi:alcohol dehydrogenase (NADP+)